MNIPIISAWAARRRVWIEEQRKGEDRARLAKLRRERELLRVKEEEMFAKPCPVNAGGLCFRGCAHFSPGSAVLFTCLDTTYVKSRSPRCKLWGPR